MGGGREEGGGCAWKEEKDRGREEGRARSRRSCHPNTQLPLHRLAGMDMPLANSIDMVLAMLIPSGDMALWALIGRLGHTGRTLISRLIKAIGVGAAGVQIACAGG